MRLSHHFIENWHKRVGNFPTLATVRGIIRQSVRIQKGMKLLKLNGQPFNTLTLYWHPDLKLILQIDEYSKTAVSVLSKENAPDPVEPPANYTPMTMHQV